ncbi:MAG: SH3 domain-containing protein [Acidobacteria bacterium]|nr:SH3 domain-containing protein [Acidobacteriota bacterium]
MTNYALTMNAEDQIWDGRSGYFARPHALNPVYKQQGRDFGLVLLGFLLGVVLLVGLMWYRGGSSDSGISTITNILDFRRKTPESNQNVGPNGGLITPQQPIQQATPFRASTLRVKVDNLTLRSCAGFDCSSLTTLPRGATVSLLGERQFAHDQEWVKVRIGSQEGWVSRYFLE